MALKNVKKKPCFSPGALKAVPEQGFRSDTI